MTTNENPKRLGLELKAVRQLKGLSLNSVAGPANISAAYLQKLENGAVMNPSPRVLYRIAEVLEISYMKLMELAGYIWPDSVPPGGGAEAGLFEQALRAEELTAEEQKAVAAFISYLKAQRDRY